MKKILIIDDDKAICAWIGNIVSKMGLSFSTAHTISEGLSKAQTEFYDIVFLDTQMPDGSGLEIISKLKLIGHAPEIIIITALGDPDEAAMALTNGAWDYVEKPATPLSIKLPILRALEYRAAKAKGLPTMDLKRKDIVGKSQRLNVSFDLLGQAAKSDVNVLITGESGTGKELFAKAIHYNSPRAKNNFVIIDCTSLPETLVESVLFGHTRGSFTSAYTNQDGLIKQADKGTVFGMKLARCPYRCKKVFCGSFRNTAFARLAETRKSAVIFASWPPPTATWKAWLNGACFARICFSGCAVW